MEKSTFIKKLICGTIMGSMMLSTGGFAFAQIKEEVRENSGIGSGNKEKIQYNMKTLVLSDEGKEPVKDNKLHKHKAGFHGKPLNTAVDKLVAEGKLSKEKGEAIKNYLKKKGEERKAGFEKLKEMPEAERKEFLKNKKKDKNSIFEEMVKDKVITQQEADLLKNTVSNCKKEKVQ